MAYTFLDIQNVPEAPTLWQEIVDAANEGWILNTWLFHEFNLCAGEQYGAVDHSFFICENGKAVGIVPLIIQEKSIVGGTECEAMYYSGFLPWPCFRQDVSHREEIEDFAFAELERRAHEAGVHHSLIVLLPPQNSGNEETNVKRIAALYGGKPILLERHVVLITDETLNTVRDRYRRYHRKYAPFFTLSIAEGAAVTSELEETFFQLHVKDAGRQSRSRESYMKQADMVQGGEGFYVVATHKDSGVIVGMLLISLYKNAAYDSSVAIDPDFATQYVSHLLKWRAIEELEKRHVPTYELGPKADPLSSTPKELGITHFKEGWSRGHTRMAWGMEKFFDTK